MHQLIRGTLYGDMHKESDGDERCGRGKKQYGRTPKGKAFTISLIYLHNATPPVPEHVTEVASFLMAMTNSGMSFRHPKNNIKRIYQ